MAFLNAAIERDVCGASTKFIRQRLDPLDK
jgi:hypothetical protein